MCQSTIVLRKCQVLKNRWWNKLGFKLKQTDNKKNKLRIQIADWQEQRFWQLKGMNTAADKYPDIFRYWTITVPPVPVHDTCKQTHITNHAHNIQGLMLESVSSLYKFVECGEGMGWKSCVGNLLFKGVLIFDLTIKSYNPLLICLFPRSLCGDQKCQQRFIYFYIARELWSKGLHFLGYHGLCLVVLWSF